MSCHPFLPVILSLWLAAPAVAEDGLTLDAALSGALTHAPGAVLAEAPVALSRAERLRAGLPTPSNPELALSLADDSPFAGTGERARGIALSQEFWLPGQRSARLAAADARLEAALHLRTWARRQVVANTASAFARVAVASRKEAVLKDLMELLQEFGRVAEAKSQVGAISELERNRIRIETASDATDLHHLRAEAVAAREVLARLVGRSVDAGVVASSAPRALPWEDFETRVVAPDPAERPDLLAAGDEVRAAEAALRTAKRDRWPRPTVTVALDEDRAVLLGDDFPADDVVARDLDRLLRIEVAFALPVLDRNRAGIAGGIARREAAEAERQILLRQAESEVRELIDRGRHLGEARTALLSAVGPAAENLEVLVKPWDVGQPELGEVLLEREAALRLKLQVEDVEADLIGIQLELCALSGTLDVFGLGRFVEDEVTPSEDAPGSGGSALREGRST